MLFLKFELKNQSLVHSMIGILKTNPSKCKEKNNNTFELEIPKSQFEKGKEYKFKFVINKTRWISAPKYALNGNQTSDNNLTLIID